MQIKTADGERNVASQGVGGTALGLGIAGTVGLLGQLANGGWGFGCGNGGFFNRGCGCNTGAGVATLAALGMSDNCIVSGDTREISRLQSKIAKLESERYTDGVGIELYREIIKESNKNDDKINANYKELAQFIAALDKQVAVDKQATVDNFAFLNNKIDTTKNEIMCYVNATFVPGVLKMPLQSICPEAMRRYNSWVAPTNPAPDTQANNVIVTEDR